MATFPYSSASGSFNGTLSSCSPTTENGPDLGSFNIIFFNADESGFVEASFTTTDGDSLSGGEGYWYGIGSPFSLTGFSGSSPDGGVDSVDLTNIVITESGSISFNYSGSNSGGFGCFFSGSGTGVVSTTIFNPVNTAPSAILNNTTTLNQFMSTFVTTLATRMQNVFKGTFGFKKVGNAYMYDTGMNAGEANSNITGVWGSWSHTTFENDFSRTKYDGDTDLFMGGIDFAPTENVIVGISVGFEDSEVETTFNNGRADSDGYTIAPYVGVAIDDTWSLDISGGMSSLDTSQNRNGGAITSDVDTDRLFASVNFTGFKQLDRWFLTGRLGALYAQSTDDEFTESDGTYISEQTNKLGQFQLAGEAAYELGEWEPYIGGTYSYDMTSSDIVLTAGEQPDNDHSDFLLSGGLRFYSKEGLTMSFDYNKRFGREDYDEETVSFTARWDF
jgi:hypothetical protein